MRLREAFPSFAATGSLTTLSGPAEAVAIQTARFPGLVVTLVGLTVGLFSAIGFLFSLAKWLLAIRHRRALHSAGLAASEVEARDSGLERVRKGE